MLYYPRCFSLKHILRPIVIDCSVMAESIRSDVVLVVPVEGGGGETPVNIHRRKWLLPRLSCKCHGSHPRLCKV